MDFSTTRRFEELNVVLEYKRGYSESDNAASYQNSGLQEFKSWLTTFRKLELIQPKDTLKRSGSKMLKVIKHKLPRKAPTGNSHLTESKGHLSGSFYAALQSQ